MTCKDCIHYDICDIVDITQDIHEAKDCGQFKDKAEYQKVKHGYWEEVKCGDGVFDYCFRCSNCGNTTPPKAFPIAPDYCPNCPAKMDGGRNKYETE